MIYLTFSEWAQTKHGVPPVMTIDGSINLARMSFRAYAETIFVFHGNETIYYKDRSGKNYQYAEDEIIMFKLKNG